MGFILKASKVVSEYSHSLTATFSRKETGAFRVSRGLLNPSDANIPQYAAEYHMVITIVSRNSAVASFFFQN